MKALDPSIYLLIFQFYIFSALYLIRISLTGTEIVGRIITTYNSDTPQSPEDRWFGIPLDFSLLPAETCIANITSLLFILRKPSLGNPAYFQPNAF